MANKEVDKYLEQHPKIVPQFKVDIADRVTPYVTNREEEAVELDREAIWELRQAQEALERELTMSQRVKASTLEEVDFGTSEAP